MKRKQLTDRMGVGTGIVIFLPIVLFAVFCFVPFLCVVSGSFSNSDLLRELGVSLLPRGFTVSAYQMVFFSPDDIVNSYLLSIGLTALGTVLNVLLTISVAFPLSRMDFRFRGFVSIYLFITIIFSGGLIPQYILYKQYLRIYNTFWVLLLPNLVTVGHIIFLRVFFQAIDASFYESARVEGASEFRIMLQVATPLILPGVATVAFYNVLLYWNDSVNAMYYLDASSRLVPISIYITRISQLVNFLKEVQSGAYPGVDLGGIEIPEHTLVYAVAVVTTLPMLVVFAFFQKYFVRGLTTGGVKG